MKRIILFSLITLFGAGQIFSQNVSRQCVLFELFTGIYCVNCPANSAGIAQMMNEELDLAPVAYHTSSYSSPDYYTSETIARDAYYGIPGYPTTKIDGILTKLGGGPFPGNDYDGLMLYYNQRIGITSPFHIDLSFEHLEGTQYNAIASVEQVGENSSSNLRIFIVLTQCNIDQYWYGMTYLSHVVRDMIPDETGTPYSGGNQTVELPFDLGTFPKDDCFLTAWVQDYSTKEVFQATRLMMREPEFDLDLAIKDVENVSVSNCSGKLQPIVKIQNMGAADIESFDAVVKINGEEIARKAWNGSPFSFYKTRSLGFEVIDFSGYDEDFNLEIVLENINGTNDDVSDNNVFSKTIMAPKESNTYVKLTFKTDDNPEQSLIQLINADNGLVVYEYSYPNANSTYTEFMYLDYKACYRMVISDAGGNGITTFFTITSSDGTVILNSSPEENPFTTEIAVEFYASEGMAMPKPPTNVSVAFDDVNLFTVAWEPPVEGATPESYNIFRDDVFIANTTETSYIDEYAFEIGSVCYSVRSVANNTESAVSDNACYVILSVNETPTANISIAPNPSQGQFQISTDFGSTYRLSVFDMTGKKVFENENFSDGILSLNRCPKGVYVVRISFDQEIISKKIVIY